MARPSLLFAFFFVLISPIPLRGNTCSRPLALALQNTDTWCWAANMEMVADYYICPSQQCWFVNDLRRKISQSNEECCPDDCESLSMPDQSVFMEIMIENGFYVVGGTFYAPASPQVTKQACGANQLIIALLKQSGTQTFNTGHVVTIYGIEDGQELGNILPEHLWVVRFMDPADGPKRMAHSALLGGAYVGGRWVGNALISGVNCFLVSIDDISGFWFQTMTPSGTTLRVRLSHSADPADSLAIYVADNAAGPARKVKTVRPITSQPPEEGTVVEIFHPLFPDIDHYYYWLDHGPGNFPAVRNPSPLDLKSNSDNPIYFDEPNTADRPIFGSPVITTITEPSLNNGRDLTVSWALSSNDAVCDGYNVYRSEVISGTAGPWQWVGFVPRGVSSFVDDDYPLVAGNLYRYKVSVAHHGSYTSLYGSAGNLGLWNDFSATMDATPVDDFFDATVDLQSPQTMLATMDGSEDTLVVDLTVTASNGTPTSGIPANQLKLHFVADSAYTCPALPVLATSSTSSLGVARFVIPNLGGIGHARVVAEVTSEFPLFSDTLTIAVKSADLDWNRAYNILDFARFAPSNNKYAGQPGYNWWCDYVAPFGYVNVQDFAKFGDMYGGDDCP